MTSDDALPRVLEVLWREPGPTRQGRGLSRDRIVAAAVELVDSEGLTALSMARLAERLGCGTMSLYRHVVSKEELLTFMLSAAPGPPPAHQDRLDWRGALSDWAVALRDVYHRHPWILQTASAGPPADPGQLAWLEAGLAALRTTPLSERDKLSAVMSLLYYVRGVAALEIESGGGSEELDPARYPDLLRVVLDRDRYPAVAAALDDGAFVGDVNDPHREFLTGVRRLLDGIAAQLPD
jgi:AcrR family transcriptional regulator